MDNKKPYNYKNCSSLFGYSAKVHIRFKAQCQLCGCGGENPPDFDLWRQMTVEHLIGKSQGGYLKQIKKYIKEKFPEYSKEDVLALSKKIDELNTVTACQFCNSTTCREIATVTMKKLIEEGTDDNSILNSVEEVCQKILKDKKETVTYKLSFIREAFQNEVV
ncbi:MAG: hypothetical protein U9Q90_07260, partial [Campylobacterota bacterium]|nr:hypothetical protein [Campylobacterota bacterium]